MPKRIVPIVEGHSEAKSIPQFLRRILHDRGVHDIKPDRCIREHRQRLVKTDIFLNRLRMAEHRDHCVAILVLFDADDDAACLLAPTLLQVASDNGITTPCRVVVAVREIEAWLIAGIESLRGYRGVPDDVSPPDNVEAIRGAKEWLRDRMANGYKETIDLEKLLLKFDYQEARTRAPSLDKLLRDIDSLLSRTVE